MTYKKRAKSNWSAGKKYKPQSNRKEREYAKSEVKQSLQEEYEGEEYRYHINKRNTNKEAKLKGKIKRIEDSIERFKRYLDKDNWTWHNDHINWLRDWLKETKEKLQKVINKNG